VTIDIEGLPRDLGGLVDGEPVLAGQVVRVVTTGGGGWGDPLERESDLVLRDVIEGRVSLAAAREEYGVVLTPGVGDEGFSVDEQATASRRQAVREKRHGELPIIDRGEGFEKMRRGEVKPWTRAATGPA
jgi:N-methylhydantoinase B